MDKYKEFEITSNPSPKQEHSVVRSIKKQLGRFRKACLANIADFSMESCRQSSSSEGEHIDRVRLFTYADLILKHENIILHRCDERCDNYRGQEKGMKKGP